MYKEIFYNNEDVIDKKVYTSEHADRIKLLQKYCRSIEKISDKNHKKSF